ncbi:MAG: aminodeoxychorismate synthase component I [Bacteroidota bacterium]
MEEGLRRLSKNETIETINELASGKNPFVFLISFSGEDNLVYTPSEAAGKGLFMEMPGMVNHSFQVKPEGPIQFNKHPMKEARYLDAFNYVKGQILYGNSFLLNLTFPTSVETNFSLREIFLGSKAPYKLLLEDELVVFSPERFVRILGDTISATPMKGTIDALVPGAHRLLSSDLKEDAEHNTIVDLIRNDLSMIASKVRVKRFKYIERLKTNQGELMQMSSEITGKLQDRYQNRLGDLLFKLLPAGSICGAPKKKTVEIIRKAEGYERGYYTGVFGHFDGENLESAVAIRYIEQQGEELVFKSGGGITFQSDWKKEYDEMQKKVYVPIY